MAPRSVWPLQRLVIPALAALAAGCGSTTPAPAVNNDPCFIKSKADLRYTGGITVPGAGDCLFTRDPATPPTASSAMLGANPTPFNVHLSLAADPATTMAINWRTTDETTLSTLVQFGQGGKTDSELGGVTFTYPNDGVAGDPVRVHEVHLAGLAPGQAYSYRVGGRDASGAERWSDVSTFHTAPPTSQPLAALNVVLIGDTRDSVAHYVKWATMLAAADAAVTPDLILFSGDAVTIGGSQPEWDDFLRVAEPVLRRVPMVTAHGNHEASQVNYFSQFAMPGDEENFALDYGAVHLTVLNDSPADPAAITTISAPLLEADLAAHEDAPWKFVLHHKPPYSAGDHGSEVALRTAWGGSIDAHKVDLVLNGHDHDYQRTRPLRAGVSQAQPTDGTTYVVAGSAGAPLYDLTAADFIAFDQKTNSFVGLKIRGKALDYKAYDDLGNVIDTLAYSKP